MLKPLSLLLGCLLLVLMATAPIAADISLAQIFTDNMVLQRNSEARIYGKAEKKQKLTVQFKKQTLNVTADDEGRWSVLMPTGEAGGPYEMTVTAAEGQPQIKVQNVMVGEVWICAGENNMKWPVSKSLNSKTEIEQSIHHPNVRLFTIGPRASKQPIDRFEKVSGWHVCSPDSVVEFSATGYFFARELSKKFPEIPIGIINAAFSSTTCEAWVSRKSLENGDQFKALLEHWDGIETEDDRERPAAVFNGTIAPLKSFPIRGVIWYQGERNNGRGAQYAKLLPTLIEDWRGFFENEDLPFYYVQLAPFRYEKKTEVSLPEVWDAQLKTLKLTEGTRMVVTTDIADVDDLHPKNKQEVGRRLSLAAMAHAYQSELPEEERGLIASGPIFQNLTTNGPRAKVTFQYSQGLRVKGNEEAVTCFSLCGPDGKFYPAQAKIEGESVVLYADEVQEAKHVRFAWKDDAQPNLINEAGLPASPFRTDDFDLTSKGKEF